MNDAREFEASDLKEAVRIAARELQIEEDVLDYEILDSGAKGFLGVGGRPVRIVVNVGWQGLQDKQRMSGGAANTIDEEIPSFLKDVLEKMEMEVGFNLERSDEYVYITMDGLDKDLILQNRAELLEAFQYLLNRIFSKKLDGLRIIADCGGFRKKKEDELRQIAKSASEKVKLSGERQELSLMNPYERRIVHLAVTDEEGVSSESSGDGFMKRVVIIPA